jgi:hypothetical protein
LCCCVATSENASWVQGISSDSLSQGAKAVCNLPVND